MVINILTAGLRRGRGAGDARPARPGPGGGLERVRDHDHRFDGLLRLPRPRGGERAGRLGLPTPSFRSPDLPSDAAQHDQDRLPLGRASTTCASWVEAGDRGAHDHALPAQAARGDDRRLAVLDHRARDRRAQRDPRLRAARGPALDHPPRAEADPASTPRPSAPTRAGATSRRRGARPISPRARSPATRCPGRLVRKLSTARAGMSRREAPPRSSRRLAAAGAAVRSRRGAFGRGPLADRRRQGGGPRSPPAASRCAARSPGSSPPARTCRGPTSTIPIPAGATGRSSGCRSCRASPAARPTWEGGRAYDPKSGSSYKSSLRLNADGSLRVTGCVLFVCRSKRWTRVGLTFDRVRRSAPAPRPAAACSRSPRARGRPGSGTCRRRRSSGPS